MFKATITNGKLIELISRTAEIIDEGIIQIKKDGLNFIASDIAMVCVVGWNLKSDAFESYELENEMKMGLNLSNLLTVLKRATGNSKITLELDRQLQINVFNGFKRSFILPLMDLEEGEMPPIDELKFKTTAEIKSDILKEGVDDSDAVGGMSVVLESDGLKRFFIKGQGNSSSELDAESRTMLTNAKATYPIEYLKKIAKTKIGETVSISYGDDYPAKFEYKNEKANIFFILAPRVGCDEVVDAIEELDPSNEELDPDGLEKKPRKKKKEKAVEEETEEE